MIKTVRDAWLRRAVLRHPVSVQLTTNYRTKTFGFLWALVDGCLSVSIGSRPPWIDGIVSACQVGC